MPSDAATPGASAPTPSLEVPGPTHITERPAGESDEPAAPSERYDQGNIEVTAGSSWVVVAIFDIAVDLPTPHACVTLREVAEPHRLVALPIAMAEANALAYAWREVSTPRPLTHELFADVLVRLGATIEVVRLRARSAGVVLAELELSGPFGAEVVPCRPSDGLTLALRQGVRAPIVVDERLFDPEGDVEARG